MRPIFVLLFCLVAALWGRAQAQLTVVTTLHPYYSLLSQLVGAEGEVIRLLPPGASPHTFDPTPRDVARIAEADLAVLNGGLDAWLNDLVAASGREVITLTVLEVLTFEPIGVDEHDEHEGEVAGVQGAAVNPHVWLDPLLMRDLVPVLAGRLAELDPDHAELFTARGEALVRDLSALDGEVQEVLSGVRGEPFVPFHDAWPYFARRYGLDLIVEIEPSPGREPSARYLAEALEQIAGSGARAIFSERQLPIRPAEVVAQNAGVALYMLDPLGGTEDTERYAELLRYNAETVAEALGR